MSNMEQMPDKNTSRENNAWTNLSEAAPSFEENKRSVAAMREGIERKDNYERYLRDKKQEIKEGGFDAIESHEGEMRHIDSELRKLDPRNAVKERLAAQKKAREDVIRAAQNAKENEQLEQFRQNQEAEWNKQTYGNNISESVAMDAFRKEYYALKQKISKDEQAQRVEQGLSIKDRAKAFKKREKAGGVVSAEEKRHFAELDRIVQLGSGEDRIEYGRTKEKYYHQIQDSLKSNRRLTKKYLRKNGIKLPKSWDDPSFSASDYKDIALATMHLR